MLLDRTCAYIDIETTGGSPKAAGITEIAVRLYHPDGEQLAWQQMLNPGKSIPPFIQRLTGITPAMVADEPFFEDIASQLYELLDDVVFVAHNARFDYSFIKAGLEYCGYVFRPKIVCTVKLAKALYPDWPSHSLDNICKQIGYQREVAHRAMADVDAMRAFVEFAVNDKGAEAVSNIAESQFQSPSKPAHIDAELLAAIPNTAGVYRFYGENNNLIYIGKSIKLRERVQSHFGADIRNQKEMRISQEVRDITWQETAGELGALLLENHEIKTHAPVLNTRQRKSKSLWTYVLNAKKNSALVPQLKELKLTNAIFTEQLYGLHKTKAQAQKWFEQIVRDAELCRKLLKQDKGAGPCFDFQLKRCRGVCAGAETVANHNLRVLSAFDSQVIQKWPYEEPVVFVEQAGGESKVAEQFHVIHHWVYLGTADTPQQVPALIESADARFFDKDTYRIVAKVIDQAQPLSQWQGNY